MRRKLNMLWEKELKPVVSCVVLHVVSVTVSYECNFLVNWMRCTFQSHVNCTDIKRARTHRHEGFQIPSSLQILNNLPEISLPACNQCSFIKTYIAHGGCSSQNHEFQKNDDKEVKSISLMHALKFERKCEKSNKWTCPAVTFCRAFCSQYYFYAVLFPTSARNLQ